MSVRKLMLMIFVLTPLAAIQTVMAGMFLNFAFGEGAESDSAFGLIILSVVLILATNLAIHKIRYNALEDHVLLFIVDFFFAPLRLPLQLISDVLGVISVITDRFEMDPRDEPDLEHDGFFGFIIIHFLALRPSAASSWRRSERRERELEPSSDPREYKWQNVRWQLKLWFFTFLHSAFTILPALYFLLAEMWMIKLGIFGIILIILLPIVYLLLCWYTAEIRCIRTTNQYYDNRRITHTTYEWNDWTEEWNSSSYTTEPGWRGFFSIRIVLYILTGWFWIIPQTLTVLIAILMPAGKVILPCRSIDINKGRLPFYERFLHDFFGVIIDR